MEHTVKRQFARIDRCSECRISEIHVLVLRYGDIVGTVEFLAFELIGQDFDRRPFYPCE